MIKLIILELGRLFLCLATYASCDQPLKALAVKPSRLLESINLKHQNCNYKSSLMSMTKPQSLPAEVRKLNRGQNRSSGDDPHVKILNLYMILLE